VGAVSEEQATITARGAAIRAAEWLVQVENRYNEDLGSGDDRNFQVESALAQGWATLAVALS
jgi:hypothetical protein